MKASQHTIATIKLRNYFKLYLVMIQALRMVTGLLLVLLFSSWGFYAHYRINRAAVYTLPKGMYGFYKSNITYLTAHAVSADKRRYVDSTEAPRHFFDADHYGRNPFKNMPRRWTDAAVKYTADTLIKYGTLPWTIQLNYYRLVKAMKNHDTATILNTSANLGHYIADAYVPLHLTQNYNGQLTGQTGIHALWESRLPELFGNDYHLAKAKARYIGNPLTEAFRICRSSFKSVDTILHAERMLDKSFPREKKYSIVSHGNRQVKDYSVEYAAAYQRLLKGMVQRRMYSAILSVGSFWYSAWIDSGQPDLNKLIESGKIK